MTTVARMALVVVSGAVLQVGVFSQLRISGAAVDILLLLVIAAGLSVGERRGAISGFCCGVVTDLLMVSRPFGLSALAWSLVGFAVGRYHTAVIRSAVWVPMLAAAVATAGAVAMYVALARILAGLDLLGTNAVDAVLLMSAANMLLVLPGRRVMRWAWGGDDEIRGVRR